MLYQLSYFRILCDFTYLWLVDISRLKTQTSSWAVMDSNHRRLAPAELQSAPFGHSGNCPLGRPDCSVSAFVNAKVQKNFCLCNYLPI